jgi:class 3 adenylate cyclase
VTSVAASVILRRPVGRLLNEAAGMGTAEVERKLAAILAADVAGYSRLMGANEEGTHASLMAHLRELIEPKIREHRGRVVKTTGDGFLATFESVLGAVRCAVEVQRGMAERNAAVPEPQRLVFRLGINAADMMIDGDDIYGDGVNIAARLETMSEPGASASPPVSRRTRAGGSISASKTSASGSSRTSPGRCASTASSSIGPRRRPAPPRLARNCRISAIAPPLPCCRSTT